MQENKRETHLENVSLVVASNVRFPSSTLRVLFTYVIEVDADAAYLIFFLLFPQLVLHSFIATQSGHLIRQIVQCLSRTMFLVKADKAI